MKIRNYLWVALSALFLTSCGSDAETSRPLEDYVSSYINVSEDVVAFGKIRMKDILDKSDYKSNLLLNSIIGDQEKKFTPLIKMENSVYYTMSGPMKEDGAPTKMTFFIEVQDEEGLKAELKSMGYDLDEKDGISYSGEDDVVIGIRGNLAIIEVSNKPENKDILAGFKLADGDKGKGKVEEILKSKGDVVLGMDLMLSLIHI